MRKIYPFVLVLFLLFAKFGMAQLGEMDLYAKSLRQVESKNYTEALKTVTKYIRRFPDSERISEVYCNRALIHSELKLNSEALADYDKAFERDPINANIIRLKANLKYKMGNVEAALSDYNYSLRIDSTLAESYAAIGGILKSKNKSLEACQYFEKALQNGLIGAIDQIREFCDSNSMILKRYKLIELNQKTKDSDYGYSEHTPIKVGGSVQRIESYISLLRNKQGHSYSYTYLKTCCPYPCKRSMFDKAVCHVYELEVDGEKTVLYFSIYEYQEPQIPVGFLIQSDFKK